MKEIIGYDLARKFYLEFNSGKDTFSLSAARKVFRRYSVMGKRGNIFKSAQSFASTVDAGRRYREGTRKAKRGKYLKRGYKSKENKDWAGV